MPYDISWLVEDRVMMIHLMGDLTIEALSTMTDESFELVRNSAYKVHAIVDHSAVTSMPNLIRLITDVPRNRHKNQGITINIMPDMKSLNKFMTTSLMQVIGLEQRFATDLDEAKRIIQKIDPDMIYDFPTQAASSK